MDDKHLSDEEKRKKEEEITKRLEEIKNRLNKKKVSKAADISEDKAVSPKTVRTEKPEKEINPKVAQTKPAESTTDNQQEVKKEEGRPKPIEIKMSGKPAEDKSWSKNTIKESEEKSKNMNQENEAKIKPIMQPKKANKLEKEEKESGFRRIRWILAGVILLILFLFTGWYLLDESGNGQDEFLLLDEKAEFNETEDSDKQDSLYQSNSLEAGAQGITEVPITSDEEEVEEEFEPEKMPEQKTEAKEVKAAVTPSIDRAKLNLPCFIMSYVSTADESKAKRITAELKGKGLSAGYYFIPDYTAGGPELFKVFVGPYPNRQSAHGDLERIRTYNKDAYYHILEQ